VLTLVNPSYRSDLDARDGRVVLLNGMVNLLTRLDAEHHKRCDYSPPPLRFVRAPTGIGCRESSLGIAFVLALRASILHVRLTMAITTPELAYSRVAPPTNLSFRFRDPVPPIYTRSGFTCIGTFLRSVLPERVCF